MPHLQNVRYYDTFFKSAKNLTICDVGKLFADCPPLTVCKKIEKNCILGQQKNFYIMFLHSEKISTSAASQS